MLVEGERAVAIGRAPVRAGLAVLADVDPLVAALRTINGHLTVRRPPVDRVRVGIAEQQVAVGVPHWTFREQEAAGDLLDARVRRDHRIEGRIGAQDARYLARRLRPGTADLERRRAAPDEVAGAGANRPVVADDRHAVVLPPAPGSPP